MTQVLPVTKLHQRLCSPLWILSCVISKSLHQLKVCPLLFGQTSHETQLWHQIDWSRLAGSFITDLQKKMKIRLN